MSNKLNIFTEMQNRLLQTMQGLAKEGTVPADEMLAAAGGAPPPNAAAGMDPTGGMGGGAPPMGAPMPGGDPMMAQMDPAMMAQMDPAMMAQMGGAPPMAPAPAPATAPAPAPAETPTESKVNSKIDMQSMQINQILTIVGRLATAVGQLTGNPIDISDIVATRENLADVTASTKKRAEELPAPQVPQAKSATTEIGHASATPENEHETKPFDFLDFLVRRSSGGR